MCSCWPCWRIASSCGHRTIMVSESCSHSRSLGCGNSPVKTGPDISRVEIDSSYHAIGLGGVLQELWICMHQASALLSSPGWFHPIQCSGSSVVANAPLYIYTYISSLFFGAGTSPRLCTVDMLSQALGTIWQPLLELWRLWVWPLNGALC